MDWNIRNKSTVKACIIVAHPDDETIFAGGLILNNKDWEWTIICVTFKNDDFPRGSQFEKAIRLFKEAGVINIKSKMLGMEDKKGFFHDKETDPNYELRKEEWKGIILGESLNADVYFTHNSLGEYGHSRHKIISEIVSHSYRNVWNFVCPVSGEIPKIFDKMNIKTLILDRNVQKQKLEIFNASYPSEEHIWKDLSETMTFEFYSGKEMFVQETSSSTNQTLE